MSEEARHLEELRSRKSHAREGSAMALLGHKVPSSKLSLKALAQRGGNLGAAVVGLTRLLERHGADILEPAVARALARGLPLLAAVRLALDEARQKKGQPPEVTLAWPDQPRLNGLTVAPTKLGAYDWLSRATGRSRCSASHRPIRCEDERASRACTAWCATGRAGVTTPGYPTCSRSRSRSALRSLERRQRRAQVGRFKMLADFDWTWPQSIDREQVEELMTLAFIEQGRNVVICGPNGVGKTRLAQNLAHRALLNGATVRITMAAEMLRELSEAESSRELAKRLGPYVNVKLLVIDEVGYLSYETRYADLMFGLVTRRYTGERPLVVTTNKTFGEWDQIFANAVSVVTLVDRWCTVRRWW